MSSKIFVGNLAWQATEDDLKSLFEQYGAVVSVKIVSDQYTGRSRGFGFVEMETDEGVDAAIAELNDKAFQGRNLRVSRAQDRPQEKRTGGGGGAGGGREFRGGRSSHNGGERSSYRARA